MAEEQILKMSELQEKIEDQAQELDALKKKLNRDVTINAPGTPSKHDLSAARDEIKGLKYVYFKPNFVNLTSYSPDTS